MNQYECRNCYAFTELDIHGRCPRCGSDSLISQQVFMGTTINDLHRLADRVMDKIAEGKYDA